ncbi:filamentous haemagglutinin family protein [Thiobacillus sp.]
MNRNIYRLVFNAASGIQVPAAETARGRGKSANGPARSLARALCVGMALSTTVWAEPAPTALPTGAVVKHGTIGMAQSGNTLDINQASQAGIIHWNNFNIGSAATVNFNQPNATSATLNRIIGNEASVIQGALNATGAVYVINRNGIVFDKGAQVNLHTLVASTLDIKDDATFLKGFLGLGGKEAAFSDVYNSTGELNLSGLPGKVEVAEGAYILSQAGGRIVLMAPDVDNKGKIETRGGQIIVAAGKKAYIRTPETSDSLLRGLVVTVEGGGTARNLGTLAAGAGGDVSLIGAIVKQQGVATASTTVSVNGTIHLLAQQYVPSSTPENDAKTNSGAILANVAGEVVIGENSRTAIMPALDRDKVAQAIKAGKLTQAEVDAYDRGETRLAKFFDYVADETLQDAQSFVPSRIVAQGRTVWVQKDAALVAPGGEISLFARLGETGLDTRFQSAGLIVDSSSGFTDSLDATGQLCLVCRVQIDAGARLDVSGLHDVAVAMERNVVEVELRGNELRDAPLLHGETNKFYEAMYGDATNLLYAKKIKVDIRDVATVDVNGESVERKGTALADASGYIAEIGRTVDEKSTAGGTINLYSEGGVVVQQGATLDVSGGSVQYRDGTVTTSQLQYKGRLYDIATATPDRLYSGLGPDKAVFEQGYLEGKDAGTVRIVAPVAALQGTVTGRTVTGRRQRGDAGNPLPQGGQLMLGFNAALSSSAGTYDYRLMNPVRFGTTQNDAPDFATPLWPDVNAPVLNPALRELVLDPNALKQNGIGRLAVYTNNAITLAPGQMLDMGAGGTADFKGAEIDIGGTIRTAGGHVNLTTEQTAYTDANAARVGMDPRILDAHLTVSGSIVTAGRWANDAVDTRLRASLAPLVIDGGAIKLDARDGALRLEQGSLLDASAGAWLKGDGKTLKAGKAGNISVRQQASLNNASPDKNQKLLLSGTLQSFGVLDSAGKAGKGGVLDLQTYGDVRIGGTDPQLDTVVWLGESFFSTGGFSGYALSSLGGDVTVADGAMIAPRAKTRLLSGNRVNHASGSNLGGFARLETLNRDTVVKAERPATDLALSAKAIVSNNNGTVTLTGGNLSVGQGAAIELDSLAKLSLAADHVLTVDGRLATPGGQIKLTAGRADSAYVPTASIWLGEDALLSAGGRARTYANGGLIQGSVLDGGDIALLANGYIMAKSGALLDASGVLGSLDLPDPASGRMVRTQLASAGGDIRLAAAEGLFIDAGATLHAGGGSAQAERGTLSVELARPQPSGTNIPTFPTPLRSLELRTNPTDANPSLATPGAALADADNGRAVLSAAHLEGFDNVTLKSADRVVFADSMQVDVRGRLTVDAPAIELALADDFASPTMVSLNAMYVNMGNGDPLYQSAAPAATAGTGELAVSAGLIDLTGHFVLSGVDRTMLTSTGDIRLNGAFNYDEQQAENKTLVPKGRLVTAGDLDFKAAQVLASTLSDFTLESTKADGHIQFTGWRNPNNALYVPPLPLSGAGRIQVKADAIEQDGVLRAPLGNIVLDAAKTLTLTHGSLTSVSAEGQAIPFGRVQNGRDWVYDLYGDTRTVYSGDDGVINLLAKDIQLNGMSVDVKTGATVDLSGGGDLVGYEFAAGPGGSQDYLAMPGVFAIMPAANPAFAPADFQANRYTYNSVTNTLAPTGASQSVKPGDSVYLSAIPQLGIRAGYYTLLPGHYALLPGAVAVRAVANTQDMLPSQNARRQDGSYLVAGYQGALGNAYTGAKRWSGFELAGRDVVATHSGFSFNTPAAQLKSQALTGRSEIADYRISQLIPAINQIFGQALPRFGQDAGRLGVTASTEMKLDGTFDFSKPDGALGGELDIAAPQIVVTDSTPMIAIPDDYLVLDADRLAAFEVDSLMIGGTREAIAGETGSLKVNQVANDVRIDATLKGPEVMLVSSGGITLADNSAVIGEGTGGLGSETLVFGREEIKDADGTVLVSGISGDGVLVRASSGAVRSVVRRNILRGGSATDGLFAASTSTVRGEKSVNLDTTYAEFNTGAVKLGDKGTLSLGATRINLGQTSQATEGIFATNALLAALGAPQAVVLKSYSNFDVYGQAALGNSTTERLVFEGAGFVGKRGTVTGDFDIEAKTVHFSNPDAAVLDDTGADGIATMNVQADTIKLGKGVVGTAGFNQVDLAAQGEIAGVDGGSGGFAASDDLKLSAQRITGYDGSDTRITAGGALVTAQAVAPQGADLPKLPAVPLGAKLALTGSSIEHGSSIELPAGWLTMTAESGDLTLKDGSSIFAGGVVREFQGANDTVKVYVAGGSAILEAREGDLTIEQNALVDVSGKDGADAGSLDIRVPQGTFTLLADLVGSAADKIATVANPDTKTPWQGTINVDALTLSDGDSATANDFSSLLARVNGFGEGFGLRQRAGDLMLAAGDTIKAQRVVLSADDGVLDLAGAIDSSADEGGWVMAAAGKELYLRNGALIDARATGEGQRGGEVYLISGMNQAHVEAGPGNGALVLENGSTIAVGGTLPDEVRFAGNNPGDPDIVLSQVTGGRVHLQAPRLASGQDVRITHKALADPTLFDSGDAIGTAITGAALVEAIGNKVFDYDVSSYTLGTAQMNALKSDTQTYMGTAAAAQTRLDPSLGSVFRVRPGVEVRNSGDLVFANDYDLGSFTAVSAGQPGNLALRAGGDLLVNGNLSDGFNSALATGNTLDSGESWAYRLVAGADLGAADPMAVQRNLPAGEGRFVLKGGKLVRTGTGAIHIAAAGDVEIGLNSDGTTYNPASVIYTAGRKDANAPVPLRADSLFKAVHPVDGGALSIDAGGAIRAPQAVQLMNNWLVRRGQEDATTDNVKVSLAWGVDFSKFNQGVGALGGGAVRVAADGDIDNLSVSLPTSGRDYATQHAGSKLLQTGGANLDVTAGGDIRSAVFYVQRGEGRIVSGGEIGARDGGLNLLLALGEADMQATARAGLALETAFNPTVIPMGTAVSSQLALLGIKDRQSSFFTYGADSAVNLVAVQGDLSLTNDIDKITAIAAALLPGNVRWESYLAYPGSLTAAALQGDIKLSNRFTLYPAARGRLHLLAGDDMNIANGAAIDMSDKDADQLSSLMHPTKDYSAGPERLSNVPTALVPVHSGDADPVRLYAERGSISGKTGGPGSIVLSLPKPVEALAGRDIVNLSVVAQNLSPDQVSIFRAGRDIRYSPARNEITGQLTGNGEGIRIGGPGYLEVVAGRHLDLGTTGGIVTTGNLDNPALPYGGADVTLLVGMGAELDAEGRPRLRLPDTEAFLAAKGELALTDYYAGLLDYERLRQALLDPDNAGLGYKEVLNKLEDPAYRIRMAELAQPEYLLAKTAFESLLNSSAVSKRAQAGRRLYFSELQQASSESSVLKQLTELGFDVNTLNNADQPGAMAGFNAGLAQAGLPASTLERYARFFERAKTLIEQHRQQPDYNPAAPYDVKAELGYAGRADTAIAHYLPESDYAGDFGGFYSQVRTEQGSDIDMLTPGGAATVGLVNAEPVNGKDDADTGLYTINGGAIRSYSHDDFLVNSSRVFTLGWEATDKRNERQRLLRDDIFLYSKVGDVDAGKGAKTASSTPPPTFTIDAQGFAKSDIGAAISGSGIGVLLARDVINRGATYLIAPKGTVNAGDAGVRASGDLFIDANRVSGLNNIVAVGLSIGVPAAVDTSGLGVSAVGNLGDAAKAASDATNSLASASEDAQKAANDMKQSLASFKPNFITVEVLGFGGESAECGKDDAACQKRKKDGS